MSTTATSLGPVSAYIRWRLSELLDMRRVVVWYDPERVFEGLVSRLELDHCAVVSGAVSRLLARREAEMAYRRLNEGDASPAASRNLLIYLPAPRGATVEEQQQDPFEAFARCGVPFGDQEAQQLQALAQLALPQRDQEIGRLFREGNPTLALLDNLRSGTQYPLVRQALGTDSPGEALAATLTRPDAGEKLEAVPGALAELQRLAQAEVGIAPKARETWSSWRKRLATYVLVSELAFDLRDGLPAHLVTVPHAVDPALERINALCDRVRETDAGRDAYVQLAHEIEGDLHLSSSLPSSAGLGTRDTFPAQEHMRLRAVVEAATAGRLAQSRALFREGTTSVWRREPERDVLWRVVDHALTFLERAAAAEAQALPSTVKGLVAAYTVDDGLWQLDQAQRRYEHGAAQCAEHDEVASLLQACRARYAAIIQRAQTAFQGAVQKEGWPPEGVRRQTQTFDTTAAPELTARRKVAYFLVDSLRYEMGRELAAAIAGFGAVTVEAAVSILPTITPCGMAALMPGADGAFALTEQHSDLIPAIGGTLLPTVTERRQLLAAKYGDRQIDLTLEEVLGTAPKALKKRVGQADLLVIRTQDIDAAGEGHSLYRAREVMSRVIGELHTATRRLVDIGIELCVFAADHGHVLLPELPAGDTLAVPPGEWKLTTRRSLLGRAQSQPPGMLYLAAAHVGIVGPVEEYVAAKAFKTFKAGEGYFHEGLSLQECVIPVVTVRISAQQAAPDQGTAQLSLSYRSDRFTSSVIGLKLLLSSLFPQTQALKLAAYESADPAAQQIGSAGECDALNLSTGEIELHSGQETQVPLLVEPTYQGERIEVRATDPKTGAILARLTLKNARLD
jgi:PglZ domain